MVQHPEPYLRDIPRVCLELRPSESSILRDSLAAFADDDKSQWLAEERLYLPGSRADELRGRLPDEGHINLDNRELWTAFHALVSERDTQPADDLRERIAVAARPMERMDAAAYSYSYRGAGWRDAREKALERDGHQCVECGDGGEKLHVHHRTKYRRHNTSEVANRLNNLETLCGQCHNRVEADGN